VQLDSAAEKKTRADGTVDDRIPIALSSEAGVERYDWMEGEYYLEILDHSPARSICRTRRTGFPSSSITTPTSRSVSSKTSQSTAIKKLRGMVRFSRAVRAQEIKQDIVDGIRKKISVGYSQSSEYEQKEVERPDRAPLPRMDADGRVIGANPRRLLSRCGPERARRREPEKQ
jgi:uncharacterized protein YbjQ (UPF0145 family)